MAYIRVKQIAFISFFLTIFLSGSINVFTQITAGSNSPQIKNTENKADQNLKSSAQVNPSTLAMEMSVPFMNYPGRNGNGLPVGINYSSKLWRMKEGGTYWDVTPGGVKYYITNAFTRFAEKSAAGWTSSISFPVIEEKLELYDEMGNPFYIDVDESEYNTQALSFLRISPILENVPGPATSCGINCLFYNMGDGTWAPVSCWRETWGCWMGETGGGGPSNGCQYSSTGYCPPSCSSCTGGGSIPEPPPTQPPPPPIQTPPKRHYVKRVHVRMPNGGSMEFRKSDAVFGYCSGGVNDGPNCEGGNDFFDKEGMFLAVDGSGMKLKRDVTGSTLFMPDGNRYLFPAAPTGNDDGAMLYHASDYVDTDGNRTSFSSELQKITDTMGREVINPLPENSLQTAQQARTQEVLLPGLGGATLKYELNWKNLKPVGCEDDVTGSCGNGNGALEDQTQILYYPTGLGCNGGSYYQDLRQYTDPNHTDYANNPNLFLTTERGVRTCTWLRATNTQNNPTGYSAEKFNPVVLAEIVLPNNQKYEFKYNRYGEITKIIYPTGSYETFKYKWIPPLSSSGNAAYDQTNRGVYEREVYNKTSPTQYKLEQRWAYSVDTTGHYKITTVAPKADNPSEPGIKTESYLHPAASTESNYGFRDPLAGMPKEERTYDENGELRQRTLYDYAVKGPVPTNDSLRPANSNARRDVRNSRSVTFTFEPEENVSNSVPIEPDPGPGPGPGPSPSPSPGGGSTGSGKVLVKYNVTEYDDDGDVDPERFSHLNVEKSKIYDFAVVSASTAATEKNWTTIESWFAGKLLNYSKQYYDYQNGDYLARGINSLPTENHVYDKNDNLLAKTVNSFDEPTYLVADSGSLSGALVNTWVDPLTDMSIPANSRSLRAKVTTSKVWDNDNNNWIQKSTQFDQYGNIRKVWAPNENNNSSSFVETLFNDPNNYTCGGQLCPQSYAYPTKVITPAPDPNGSGHGTSEKSELTSNYDFTTGLSLKTTNLNSLANSADDQTTVSEYDSLLRLKKVVPPAGSGIIEMDYGDAPGNLYVKTKKQITASSWNESTSLVDSLGRVYQVESKDSQKSSFIDSEFDSLGRVKRTSKPYFQGDSKIWIETVYDAIGRTSEIVSPKISNESVPAKVKSKYAFATTGGQIGTVVISTNPAGKNARSIVNALGQLIRFDEPNDAGELGAIDTPVQATYYKYDSKGNLVEVSQGTQRRYFLYDSLGRLIRIKQPEQDVNQSLNLPDPTTGNSQWSAAFSYDVNGNLSSSIDAKGVAINYSYDKLNRLITRNYTIPQTTDPKKITYSTSNVTFKYDGLLSPLPDGQAQSSGSNGKGQLTEVANGISKTQITSFDSQGRVTKNQQIIDDQVFPFEYKYNLAGSLVEEKYPSGRIVTSNYDESGDLSSVTGQVANQAPRYYARNFVRNANGDIQRVQLGNGRYETFIYNTRSQIREIGLGTSATANNLWKVNYDYGRLDQEGALDAAKNDGNVVKQTITVPGMPNTFVQSYSYDSINRLTEAVEKYGTSPTWKQTFQYDRYGNRIGFSETTGENTTTVLNNINNPTINSDDNRITSQGYEYDFAGNLIQDAEGRKFKFDAENKQRAVTDLNGNVLSTYSYDADGRRVKKTVTSTQEEVVFIYNGFGKLVAEYSNKTQQNPTTSYLTTDINNSVRVITNQLGQVVSRRDFKPFGEQLYANTPHRSGDQKYNYGDDISKKFAGYERDYETSLDFAEARYYNGKHGRFTAVDPLTASGRSSNPQTFNRYVYAGNNPLIRNDPSGTDWCTAFVRKMGAGYRGESRGSWVTSWAAQCSPNTRVKYHVYFSQYINGEIANKWVALNPYDGNFREYDTRDAAQAGVQQFKVQAMLDFLMGVAEANSLILDLTGAAGYVANRKSTPFKIGLNAGAAAAIVKAGFAMPLLIEAIAQVAAKYGLKSLIPMIRSSLKAAKAACCFVAGTLIHTDKGLVPIEKIKVGDKVLSYNEKTKQYEYKAVAETFTAIKDNIVKLKIAGEKKLFTTTTEHPFYIKFKRTYRARNNLVAETNEDGEWKTADELKVGDKVLRPDGKWTRILSIERETAPTFVYNFEVEGNHNYFVGEIGVLSHNCSPGQFKSTDIALGLFKEGLAKFKGAAKTGTDYSPDFINTFSLIDAIKKGIDDIVENGGKIRFNLEGFNANDALNPASEFYNSYTSQEFRYVWERYRNSTIFYRNGERVYNPF